MSDIPELTEETLKSAMLSSHRHRLIGGKLEFGTDVTALRRFVGMSQLDFAEALGVSIGTLRNWEMGRRRPEGPALTLMRIAARRPRVIRELLDRSR